VPFLTEIAPGYTHEFTHERESNSGGWPRARSHGKSYIFKSNQLGFEQGRTPTNEDLAVLAVCCELVSAVNSLLTGKFTGNLGIWRRMGSGLDGTEVTEVRAFLAKAGPHGARMKQGILNELSGKTSGANREMLLISWTHRTPRGV
jgi:hypothetical protein